MKRDLPLPADKAAWSAVGESWELSLDPSFPSRDLDGELLADHIARDPEAWLGPGAPDSPLLVKLLDARDVLSVQVHPADGDPTLGPQESGKPEAWVVLAREPGAGLWLGLAEGVTRHDFATALDRFGRIDGEAAAREIGDRVAAMLNFVPVEPGDTFVIEAGTVHAIGPGLTLLEPQLVRPGKTGVTYRFWDWGRRYDAAGRLDPAGAPRTLHRDRSLAVTAWDAPRGAAFVAHCRRHPRIIATRDAATHERLIDDLGMRVDRLVGTGHVTLAALGSLAALVVTQGAVDLGGVVARGGQTLALPATLGPLDLVLDEAQAFLVQAVA